MKYVNHDAPKPQTTHLGEQNWWWRPSASSSSRYDSWVLLMERHPASGPQAVYLSASFLELALQIQHMLTASFHLGKLKMSASNSQSPRTCTRAPFHLSTRYAPPSPRSLPCQSVSGVIPVNNTFMDHENNSNIASMVPGTMSDFFTTMYTNLFFVFEPVPNREFHVNTHEESCLENASPSPCFPSGTDLAKTDGFLRRLNLEWMPRTFGLSTSVRSTCAKTQTTCCGRNGCFARPALRGISCHQNSGAPVGILNTEQILWVTAFAARCSDLAQSTCALLGCSCSVVLHLRRTQFSSAPFTLEIS